MLAILLVLAADLLRLFRLMFRSRAQLAAESLFLRKQLACYIERQVRTTRSGYEANRRRTDNASRIVVLRKKYSQFNDAGECGRSL